MTATERIARQHPELFARIRMACGDEAATSINLDDHAAAICTEVMRARRENRLPFSRRAAQRRRQLA